MSEQPDRQLMASMVVQKATAEARTYLATIDEIGLMPETEQTLLRQAFTVGYLAAWQQREDLELFLEAAHGETSR